MNALRLFRVSASGRGGRILGALAIEWLHSALAAAPNGLLVWLVWRLVIDHSISRDFWLLLALMVGLFGLQLAIAPGVISRTANLSYHLSCRLRELLAAHAGRLGLGVYGGQRLGTFADRLNQAIDRFEFVLSHSLTNLLAAISTPALLLGLLAWLDWRLCLLMAACMALTLAVQLALGRWLAAREAASRRGRNALRGEMLDQLGMLPVLKSYASGAYWRGRYARLAEQAGREQLLLDATAQPLAQLTGLLLDLGFTLCMWLGVALFINDSLSLVNLLLFALIGYRVFEPIKALLADWLLLRQVDDELKLAVDLLNHKPLPVSGERREVRDYVIRCRNLTFAYAGSGEPVLNNLSADFPQGKTTALVGFSGAGKTTLLQLLMRFWDPSEGDISIGGAPLTCLSPDAIASLYAPVFQQPYLFNDSLLNNVRFGGPNASEEELARALDASGCAQLAKSLQRGLHTNLGEGGRLLSGGQQQLVAIARCLLKDAPIVLFDEATAALDPENSRLVYQAADRLGEGKTRIVIAHDLARIRNADQILVLDMGRIAEQGSHEELLQGEGVYARLWRNQRRAEGWRIGKREQD